MNLVQIATEQTTAATDLLLALVAICSIFYLRGRLVPGRRRSLWVLIYLSLAVAAFAGAIAHGIVLSPSVKSIFWLVIYLALALLVALFVCAVALDVFGEAKARPIIFPMLAVALCFFVYSALFPTSFLPFIIYETLAMTAALLGYAWLVVARKQRGAGWLLCGVALTLVAAAVQATKAVAFDVIWSFDHNGVYHLLQMVALFILLVGVVESSKNSAT